MKKRIFAALLGATMALSIGAVANAEEKTVITFYEHSDNEKIVQALVDAYNASQDAVEVQLSIIANDDYDDKIKVMLSGGADIDAFWVRSGGQVRQMANGGAILPLDELMAEHGIDFSVYGPMGDAFKTGDQTYGLCTTKSCWLLWYNKDLFDAAGLEYPVDLTWDEYADLCAQLTTDELRGGLAVNWIMNTGAAAAGEYLTSEDLTYTKEYAAFLNRIYNEDNSNMSLEEMSGSFDVNAVFGEGNTYMMLNGDWEFQLLEDANLEFEYGAAPLPHFEDIPVNSSIGQTSAFCINANSEHIDEAFDFIKFCCYSDEGAKIYASFAGVPTFPSDAALDVYKESVTTPGTEYVFSSIVSGEDGNEDYYAEVRDAYQAEVTEYLLGACTLDEAFETFTERRAEIIAEYE